MGEFSGSLYATDLDKVLATNFKLPSGLEKSWASHDVKATYIKCAG
ncbi:hypothetical protein [Citrobacter sp. wls826]|nr:hypothetical protein [Citrobacter sp. wls826]